MHESAKDRTSDHAREGEQIAYTVKHAAQVLDIGERTLWELVRSGEVKSFKIGWSRRITRAALEEYIAAQPESLPGEGEVAA